MQESGTSAVHAVIQEIVYTGPTTRYVAATEHGAALIIQEQNGAGSTGAKRGDNVRLEWPTRFNYTV
ncbi:TOBE domain protein [compost metagenome]